MRSLPLLAAAALLSTGLAAHADTFLFTATAPGFNAVATLVGTADPSTPGAFDFTSGSGTLNGVPITLYTPSGTSTGYQEVTFTSPPFSFNSFYQYDNVGYTGIGQAVVDTYGLLFAEADDHINIFSIGLNYVYSDDEIISGYNTPLPSVTLTQATAVTPEPSSLALLGTGLLGLLGLGRKRLA